MTEKANFELSDQATERQLIESHDKKKLLQIVLFCLEASED